MANESGESDRTEVVLEILHDGLDKIRSTRREGSLTAHHETQLKWALAHPQNADALLYAAGIFLHALGMPDTAVRILLEAVKIEPDSKPLQKMLASAQQTEVGITPTTKASIKLPPKPTGAHYVRRTQSVAPSARAVIRSTGRMLSQEQLAELELKRTQLTDNEAEAESHATLRGADLLKQIEAEAAEGKWRVAAALARRVPEQAADEPERAWKVLTSLAWQIMEQGDPDVAVEINLLGTRLYPQAVAAWYNLGQGLRHAGRVYEAFAAFDKALELEPGNSIVLSELAGTHFDNEDYEKSEEFARQAVSNRADLVEAWDRLAAALAAQDKQDEAIQACREGLKTSPDSPRLFFKLGVLLYEQEDFDEAEKAFIEAARTPDENEKPYIIRYQCLLASKKGDFDRVIMLLEDMQSNPQVWVAWNDLVIAYIDAGKYERAAWAGRQSTKLKPDSHEAWYNLGLAYQMDQSWTDAEDAYERAIQLDDKSASSWHNLGVVRSEQGDYPRAAQALHKVAQFRPEDATAYYDLSVALERAGKDEEATEARERAVALGVNIADPTAAESVTGGQDESEDEVDSESLAATGRVTGAIPHSEKESAGFWQRILGSFVRD